MRGCSGDQLVSRFVCDGRVNCMMPGREAVDEEKQFCSRAPDTEADTGNKDPNLLNTASHHQPPI